MGKGRADTYRYLRAAVAAARAAGVARPAKLIAAGISMGGGMALWAQCTLPDVFSGVASIAGWSGVPCGRINPEFPDNGARGFIRQRRSQNLRESVATARISSPRGRAYRRRRRGESTSAAQVARRTRSPITGWMSSTSA